MSSHHDRRCNKSVSLQLSTNRKHEMPKKMVVRTAEQAILEKVNGLTISPSSSEIEDNHYCRASPSEPTVKSSGTLVCAVCHMETPVLTNRKINAVTKCKHVFCFECALRLLFISVPNTPKGTGIDCPICRQHTEHVFLTCRQFTNAEQIKDFVDYWWSILDDRKVIFYGDACVAQEEADEIMPYIDGLMVISCEHCGWTQKSILTIFKRSGNDFNNLASHFVSHRKDPRFFCRLCFDNLQFFPLEMAMYDEDQLREHLRRGSHVSGDAFVRHQRCTLCFGNARSRREINVEQYFFDEEALLEHAKKNHLICYLCTDQHTFYLDLEALDEHIGEDHFPCTLCKEAAYGSVAELRTHVESIHPENEAIAAAAAAAAAPASSSSTTAGKLSKKSTKKKHQPLDIGTTTFAVSNTAISSNFIDFEALERREIAKKTASATSSSLILANAPTGSGSAAEAVVELDGTFRRKYNARQNAHPPSFEPKANSETYALHFPTIDPGARLPMTSSGEPVQFNLGASVYNRCAPIFRESLPLPELPPPETSRTAKTDANGGNGGKRLFKKENDKDDKKKNQPKTGTSRGFSLTAAAGPSLSTSFRAMSILDDEGEFPSLGLPAQNSTKNTAKKPGSKEKPKEKLFDRFKKL